MKKLLGTGVAGLMICAASSAQNLVLNPGFETNNVAAGSYLYSHQGLVANPWVFGGGTGVTASFTAWGSGAATGNYFAFLQTGPGGGTQIEQTLTGLVSGQQYEVKFAARRRPLYGANPLTITVGVAGVVASFVPANDWTTYTGTFTASSTSALLSLQAGAAIASSDAGAFLDDISVTAVPVPEPATMAVVSLGLAAMATRRKRRSV